MASSSLSSRVILNRQNPISSSSSCSQRPDDTSNSDYYIMIYCFNILFIYSVLYWFDAAFAVLPNSKTIVWFSINWYKGDMQIHISYSPTSY